MIAVEDKYGIAEALKQLDLVEKVLPAYTNIVIFTLRKEKITGEDFEMKLADANIRVAPFGKQTVRMVTHLGIDDEMTDRTIQCLRKIDGRKND